MASLERETSQRWPQSETTEPSTVTVLNLNGIYNREMEEKKSNNNVYQNPCVLLLKFQYESENAQLKDKRCII